MTWRIGAELHVIDLSPEGAPSPGWESLIREVGGTYQRATSTSIGDAVEALTSALKRERILSFAGDAVGHGSTSLSGDLRRAWLSRVPIPPGDQLDESRCTRGAGEARYRADSVVL